MTNPTTSANIAPTLLPARHKGNAKPVRKGQQMTAKTRQNPSTPKRGKK